MAQWYTFCEQDDFEPEIQIGLYHQWVHRIENGTTQADRAFVHTDMMQLAHERRFVVSETAQDNSHFEAEHSEHMAFTVNILQAKFDEHSLHDIDDRVCSENQALVGLAPLPYSAKFKESSLLQLNQSCANTLGIEEVLQQLCERPACEALPSTETKLPYVIEIDVDDADHFLAAPDEDWSVHLEQINRQLSRKSRRSVGVRPRQWRDVRVRNKPIPCSAGIVGRKIRTRHHP